MISLLRWLIAFQQLLFADMVTTKIVPIRGIISISICLSKRVSKMTKYAIFQKPAGRLFSDGCQV